VAAPLMRQNVDTDLIIRIERLVNNTGRKGLGPYCFEQIRLRPDGSENPDCVFNQEPFREPPIILSAENFGCGSSREHAAWALLDLGIRAVIAPSFSDIFAGNAFKNGIVTVALDEAAVETLLEDAREHSISVDLERLEVTSSSGRRFAFAMDDFRRDCLIAGRDEIALTLVSEPAIRAYESRVGI